MTCKQYRGQEKCPLILYCSCCHHSRNSNMVMFQLFFFWVKVLRTCPPLSTVTTKSLPMSLTYPPSGLWHVVIPSTLINCQSYSCSSNSKSAVPLKKSILLFGWWLFSLICSLSAGIYGESQLFSSCLDTGILVRLYALDKQKLYLFLSCLWAKRLVSSMVWWQ